MSDVYVGAGNFLKKLTGDGEEIWSYTYDATITGLVEGGDDNLYVTGGNSPTHVVSKSGLFVKEITELRGYLTKDYQGNVYGFSSAQGTASAMHIHRYNVTTGTIEMSTATAATHLYSMCVDDSGNIYAVRDPGGTGAFQPLLKYDQQGDLLWWAPASGAMQGTRTVALDGDGFVWFGRSALYGLRKGDPATGEYLSDLVIAETPGLINALAIGPEKQYIYAGLTTSSIRKVDTLNETYIALSTPNNCNSLAVDDEGNLYAGFSNGYLRKYDPAGGLVWEEQVHTSSIGQISASVDNYRFFGTVRRGGAPVPGAKVTLIRSLTGSTRTKLTDSEGKYQFNGLIRGENYHLCCEYEDGDRKYNSMSYPFVKPAKEG